MSRSFILINKNSTKLGYITNNPSSSDLTKDAKNNAIRIGKQCTPKKDPQKGPIFKICTPPTKCCDQEYYNKTILNSNLRTYEDLNGITTIQVNDPNSPTFTEPIYNHYTIDPNGVLFGDTPCQINNYLQFRRPLVDTYPTPPTPSNVVATVTGTYDNPEILISWDYGILNPSITVSSYSIYGYDETTSTQFGPYIIPAYTYTYLLTEDVYDLILGHSYSFTVYSNTSFNTSLGGTSNTVLLVYAPETSTGPIFTLYSYTTPLTFQRLLTNSTPAPSYAIIVNWTSTTHGANIVSYTIRITATGYNMTYSISNPNTTSYTIDGLSQYTNYTIVITSTTSVNSSTSTSYYTIGTNFNFNYKTTDSAISRSTVLTYLPLIRGNGLTINDDDVYVNIQPDTVDLNKQLVSVEIPVSAIHFTDNTTTTDGLSFQTFDYYFNFNNTGKVTEINVLFFGNNGTTQSTNLIPLSRGGGQFGLGTTRPAYDGIQSDVILTISTSDKPYILENTSFEFTFRKLNHFNSDISGWDVKNVTKMGQMFLRTGEFNQDLSGWNVSKVTDMSYMFNDASKFNNGDTGNNELHALTWTTSALTSVEGMFNGASKFNQDISTFVLNNLTNTSLQFTFYRADVFNQDISGWNVTNVQNMSNLFTFAYAFNKNLDAWGPKLSNVTNMNVMFYGATNFNNGGLENDTEHPMTSWAVNSNVIHDNFATGSKLYHTGYLNGNIQPNYWEYTPLQPTGVTATYKNGSHDNYLVDLSWNLVDGATSYNVKLTTNGNDAVGITQTSPYTFSGLSVNNTYSFSVQAVNSQGGSSAYNSATVSSPTVGTIATESGIDVNSINYADITLTGASGQFYQFTTSPNTRVSNTQLPADSWITSNSSTVNCQIKDLITNFQYTFTITSYNIAGSAATSTTSFTSENNFMFSYTTTELPPSTSTSGDLDQNQREGIFNYLPFYKGDPLNYATTGQLTLNSQLYISNQYIKWSDVNSIYTVTVSFPKVDSNGTLWTYTSATSPSENNSQAGVAITGNTAFYSYYTTCRSITYTNFGSIYIASNQGLFYGTSNVIDYTGIFNITNNSIPRISNKTSLFLLKCIKPSVGSSINLLNWDVSNVQKMNSMLTICDFNTNNVAINISNWNVSNVTDMSLAFFATAFSSMEELNWNLANITSVSQMFRDTNFNSDLNFIFPTTRDFNLVSMFESAQYFNRNINTRIDETTGKRYWDVSSVNNMRLMFLYARSFNQPLDQWDVGNVTNMESMFYDARSFDKNISSWDVSSVTTMENMFSTFPEAVGTYTFNQNLDLWGTKLSKVTNMNSMFNRATNFNNGGVENDTTRPMTSWAVNSTVTHVDFATGSKLYHTDYLNGNMQPNYWDYAYGVSNGNFNTTPPVPYNSYHRPSNNYTIDSWTWNGNGVFVLNQSLVSTPYPNGDQCVLFQIYYPGISTNASISQDITLYAGTYKFNLYLIQRGNPLTLSINIGNIFITTITPPSSSVWTSADAITGLNLNFEITTTDTYTLHISASDPNDPTNDYEVALQGVSITLASLVYPS